RAAGRADPRIRGRRPQRRGAVGQRPACPHPDERPRRLAQRRHRGGRRPPPLLLVRQPMTPAARVIDFVYDRLQIDEAWAMRESAGFAWWAGVLAQRLWSSPERDADGVSMSTVHIETEIINGVADADAAIERLAGINQLATLSAYVWQA